MSLPQPSKLCAKKDYFKNISISQEICNERLSKVDSLRADYLNSAYDDKFEHLPNKDGDFDIDCSLTLDEQYLESCDIKSIFFNNSFKNTFTVLALNIRSIANALNFSKLKALMANLQCKPDVISVCETWIKPLHSGPYCNLNGYKFVSNCRKISRGGGVAFFVKNSLQFDIIDELFVMNEKIFESLFINVKVGKATVVCGVIYCSPSDDLKAHQEFKFQLTECLEKLDAKRKCFIFGDFNHDLAKSVENTHVRDFTEVI